MSKWLHGLTLHKLHRLAVSIGSPCSGSKPVRIAGIQDALAEIPQVERIDGANGSLSIVSIDMGIRNLAYTCLETSVKAMKSQRDLDILVQAWQRRAIGNGAPSARRSKRKLAEDAQTSSTKPEGAIKESFEPKIYAAHAYDFINEIIDKHKPTHVLIERQRLRSGGQSAVQEWTIRDGEYEGMLYAVLGTLIAQGYRDCSVLPMSPAAVNRYWLNEHATTPLLLEGRSRSSKAVKDHKIGFFRDMLKVGRVENLSLSFSHSSTETRDAVTGVDKKTKSSSKGAGYTKLDDVSDCLLQGLAWVKWQQNRIKLQQHGLAPFDLT